LSARHSRQTRLREIGEGGQRRIGAATAIVASTGFAAEIEARYLAGAGFGRVVVADAASSAAARAIDPSVVVEQRDAVEAAVAAPFAAEIADPSARAVAEGAWRALAAIRAAVRAGLE
jgi:molybdopterin/thiamine biosynthesis adenylyltransferase